VSSLVGLLAFLLDGLGKTYSAYSAFPSSTSAIHAPNRFSIASSALDAYGSRPGPACDVRLDGRESERWIWFGGKRLAEGGVSVRV
jgi:hypothetical protein